MDVYDAAIKRLRADTRHPKVLSEGMQLPLQTVKDIINGKTRNPQVLTVKQIVKFYFPKHA